MSGRSYRQRCEERIERLRYRIKFLDERIARDPDRERVFDKQERSALLWVIEEIERWDTVAEVIESDTTDADKVNTLQMLLRSRLRPSEPELARHPALAKRQVFMQERIDDQNRRLREAARGLLAFIQERFPDDFKPGGSGFTCPHHRAIAQALGVDGGTPVDSTDPIPAT